MKPVFALVDCNNFYASCEKLMRPDLRYSPVVVLSNNDGCIVARSREAKALGIQMGAPLHQIQDLIRTYNIKVFSSNYALYGDISHRVMQTLETLAPSVEAYSIDEAFLDLTGVSNAINLTTFGRQIKNTVYQHIGIPVCVGIAPTKTLAKLANHAAKQYPATQGVVELSDSERLRKLLSIVPIEEVWGIGNQLSKRLNEMGIFTALDLAKQNPKNMRKMFSVVMERTIRELNGESCLPLEEANPTKQQIICSRSFGTRVTTLRDMFAAVSSYTAKAAEKLRREQQHCQVISVYVRTGFFNTHETHYSNSISMKLEQPTNDTRTLLKSAKILLEAIWKDGYRYAKAGVLLTDLFDCCVTQPDLFSQEKLDPTSSKLMSTLDQLNMKYGGKLYFASQGVKNNWQMNRRFLSPCYTTNWNHIPVVR